MSIGLVWTLAGLLFIIGFSAIIVEEEITVSKQITMLQEMNELD